MSEKSPKGGEGVSAEYQKKKKYSIEFSEGSGVMPKINM